MGKNKIKKKKDYVECFLFYFILFALQVELLS